MYLLKMFWNKNCLISLFWSCVGKFCKVNYNGKRKRNTFSWNFYETKREKHTQIPIQIVFKLLRLQVDAVRWAKVIILKFSRGKGAEKVDRERVLLIPSAAGCWVHMPLTFKLDTSHWLQDEQDELEEQGKNNNVPPFEAANVRERHSLIGCARCMLQSELFFAWPGLARVFVTSCRISPGLVAFSPGLLALHLIEDWRLSFRC